MNQDEDDDEDEEDTSLDAAAERDAAARVCVLHRADYRVTDVAAVLHAGRSAYLEIWPADDEDDAAADIADLGRALYRVMHAGGLPALLETPGLQPAGATTWIAEATELLDEREPEEWPDNPFALAEAAQDRLLYRLDEVDG